MPIAQEPSFVPLLLTNFLAVCVLIGFYFFGVWSRNFVFPADKNLSWGKQLVAAIPVGFITMGVYAKSALPPLTHGTGDAAFDVFVTLGYAIVLGMMSRETLEKILGATRLGSP